MDNVIATGLGKFSKEKFNALLTIRSTALSTLREALVTDGYIEVSTSSLVNIAGSCENPYNSFRLNYYGREAHLSQSAQLQLEALVIRLKRAVFTISNSFREEDYADPEAKGRRLSEFTLVESERPFEDLKADEALTTIISTEERVVKNTVKEILEHCEKDVALLNGNVDYLKSILVQPFNRITYDEALALLNKQGGSYKFGDDLGVIEEKRLLLHFGKIPVFVTHYPAKIKFFNMKRTADEQRVFCVDLLTPQLGETSGGAVREENGEQIKAHLLDSKIANYVREQCGDPLRPFEEYLNLFKQEKPTIRGGFGIGFERLVGFLLDSNDILETIAYRSMRPQ
jgi:asparaginyl-tRNA synthetase